MPVEEFWSRQNMQSIVDCIDFEVIVCVYGDLFPKSAVSISIVKIVDCSSEISAPNQLGIAARDLLLNSQPVALSFMEDDLVIHDYPF